MSGLRRNSRQITQPFGSGELCIAQVPPPAVEQDGLLVQTAASLVSVGTERSMLKLARKSLVGKALARPDLVAQVVNKVLTEGLLEAYRQSQARLDAPVSLGYSSSGTVTDVGPNVKEFAVGDRVACTGSGYASHAEVVSVPRNLCVKIPKRVTFEQASFVALGGIALEAVRMAKAELGHRVAVVGLGLLGQLAVQLLKANGCSVMGIDLVADRLNLARQLGADVAVNGAADDIIAAVGEFSAGHGVDSVIIMAAAESNQPLEQAAEICRERGRVVATGLVGLEIPRKPFYEKELEFVISRAWGPGMYDVDYEERDIKYPLPYVRWTAQQNMATFLDLVAQDKVNVDALISHRFPFERALEAYDMILDGKEPCIGVVLQYDQTPPSSSRRIDLKPKTHPEAAKEGEIGIGLIGAGLYARGTLLPALRKVKGVRYAGVATSTGLSARHVGDKFGFRYCTTDYQQLLQDDDIRAVLILTRHSSHARLTAEALRSGKAVFVEKPLALSADELKEVVRAWHEGSGFLMVGLNRRFAPTTNFIRDRLQRGTGPLVAHCRCNAGYIPSSNWVHHPEEGGGRIIGEVCHFVDLLQALTDALPMEVSVAAAGGNQANLRDNIAVSLKLDNDSIGSIVYTAGGDKSFPREYVEVFGHGAVGTIDNFRSARFTQSGRASRKRSLGVDRGHSDELKTFFHHLRSGKPQPVEMREYVATTLATFAMEESITTGESVKVNTDEFLKQCMEE